MDIRKEYDELVERIEDSLMRESKLRPWYSIGLKLNFDAIRFNFILQKLQELEDKINGPS